MQRTLQLLSVLLIITFVISCANPTKTDSRSSGKTAEMIISLNNKTYWEGKVGDSIKAFFNRDFEVLPQVEPLFEMAFIPISKLTDHKSFLASSFVSVTDLLISTIKIL